MTIEVCAMHGDVEFFVDGRPVTVAGSSLSVRELLKMADKPVDGDYVVSRDGIEYDDPDQSIDVRSGDKIEIRRKPDRTSGAPHEVHYKVNGEDQVTTENPLTAEEIVRRAGNPAAIDVDDLGSYLLERVDGSKYDRPADAVTIRDGDEFLAIHRGPTPVAWAP